MINCIKVERARHNLSQGDLAEKIGVSRQTVHAIENRKFIPSTVLALKMAALFNMSVNDLFQLEEKD